MRYSPKIRGSAVGKTSSYFVTLERERLRGQLNKAFALIQPNPCKAQHGLTSDGRPSFHAETNVLERRYLIVEFDDAKDWNDSDALDSASGSPAASATLSAARAGRVQRK